jgi:hypothetical protein
MPSSMQATPKATIVNPSDERLSHTRWLYCWGTDPLDGHCLCPRGSSHRTPYPGVSIGQSLDCGQSPGKHPHPTFPHGAKDAVPYDELISEFSSPGGQRRMAMCLNDVIVIDIDSEQALQSFYRIRKHVPMDRVMGVARTPRGWHVFLHCPEWTQVALNKAMTSWLAMEPWDGTDKSKVGRRGILLDVRTGDRRYVIWPGQGARDRRWVALGEFTAALQFAGRGMPSWRMVTHGEQAPWNLAMTDELREKIARIGADAVTSSPLAFDGSDADRNLAWRELERWASMIEKMAPETGRNNSLNRTAYFSGSDALRAGWPREAVENRLIKAALISGTPGADATIASGLNSGLRDRHGNT